jgi:hypothetical protein
MQDALLSEGERIHSLNLLAHMSPRALLLLLPLVALQEPGAGALALALARQTPAFGFVLALNCAAAAGVNMSNFLVTRATSALTLQVLGKAKSIIAVGASLAIFQNPVSPLGMGGYGICLLGVVAYSRSKSRDSGGGGDGVCRPTDGSADVVAGLLPDAEELDLEKRAD